MPPQIGCFWRLSSEREGLKKNLTRLGNGKLLEFYQFLPRRQLLGGERTRCSPPSPWWVCEWLLFFLPSPSLSLSLSHISLLVSEFQHLFVESTGSLRFFSIGFLEVGKIRWSSGRSCEGLALYVWWYFSPVYSSGF